MKAAIFLAALFAAVALAAAAPLLRGDMNTAIPDEYLVVFKQVSKAARESHIKRVKSLNAAKVNPFVIGNFSGYSALLMNSTLSVVLNMPEVDYVETDHVVTVTQSCSVQAPAPSWGLDRIAEIDINFLDSRFPHADDGGQDTDVYIIDTGVYIQHNDFAGRAIWGINYADSTNDDCNGHGTHVAGTVAGTNFGIAKKATIIAVKVLGCGGSGSWAGVISGIQWTAERHATSGRPSSANLSLGGGYNLAVNQATAAAVAAGVVMVCAAGNSNTDACTFSPASTVEAISVGSTQIGANPDGTNKDQRSSFSNFGTCTDVFAPGSLITSAWIGSPDAQNTISGTSMAAPHIAGVVSTIQGKNPSATPAEILRTIAETGNKNLIDLACGTNAICTQSPNVLGYIHCA